jgi:hypothetical protein
MFAGKDGIENTQATQSGDLGQYALDLQVHQIQRLLNMHDVFGCHLDQATAMIDSG